MHWLCDRTRFMLLAYLALLLCWTACAARSEVNRLGTSLAIQGQQVCDAALQGYRALEEHQRTDERQQELVRILTHPQPDALKPRPRSDAPGFDEQIRVRVRAFRKLREAYLHLQRLSGDETGEGVEQASRSVLESAQALRGVAGLSSQLTERISELSGRLAESLKARHVRRRNAAFLELLRAYRQLWEADLPIWRDFLDRVQTDFADGLASVPSSRFDSKQLTKILKEPFAVEVQVALYKRDLRFRSAQQAKQLRDRLEAVSGALRALESAHLELSKQKPSFTEALQTLQLAGGILEDIRNLNNKEEER